MGVYDYHFNALIEDILDNGVFQDPSEVRAKYADGTPAIGKSVQNVQMKFDNSELLFPTTKTFYPKSAEREISWIWRHKSNRLSVLRDLNKTDKTVWDEWEITDPNNKWYGTIGPAYGYILGRKTIRMKADQVKREHLDRTSYMQVVEKNGDQYIMLDQVDNVIQSLLTDKSSRSIMTTLWDPKFLSDMSLKPCVWSTQWNVYDNKLNLTVNIRSNDLCLGNGFNVFQYQLLQMQVAQIVSIELGTIVFNITDAHIYDRHIDVVVNQIREEILDAPKLELNKDIKNFYDFTSDDVHIHNVPKAKSFKYEIAI